VSKKDIAIGVAGLALLGTTVAGLSGWYLEHQRVADLESQLAEAQQQEKRSVVVRSISKQMEEIAYQQKEISDEQREEAIQQKKVADEMRQRSEVERMNALVAREQAVASEKQAQDARQIAESERQMAEHQRLQAELSKRMTDTLSYVALARSLGSLSSTQSQLDNTELADQLAYSAYIFANRYKGDVYNPAIFQSLMTASHSMRSWARHYGSVMCEAFMSNSDNRMVTVSTYGEIMIHEKKGDELHSQTLLRDKNYDFRGVIVSEDVIYAISRTGHLVIIDHGNTRVLPLPDLTYPMSLSILDENSILLVGSQGVALYDKQRKMIVASRELDYKLTAVARYDNYPLLFDDQGRQHQVKGINDFVTSSVPFRGRVTAFASSKNTRQRVYGMIDGTIYLYDEQSGKTTKLEGHLSRISKMKMNGQRLYSSSYDGTVKMWNTNSEKIEPVTLISANSWIMDFNFDNSKQYVWIGDQNGNLTEALLSVPMMAERVSKQLKRDFTTEEWNYYIGRNVPYESFIGKQGKEVAP
jgi:hypothetical protein